MSILARLSPDARCYVVEDLAEAYFKEEFSSTFRNGPTDERERRIYQELVAVGLMEPTGSKTAPYRFTEAGLREILELRPMSPEAEKLLTEVKQTRRPGEWFGELVQSHRRSAHDELVARRSFVKGSDDQYALAAGA